MRRPTKAPMHKLFKRTRMPNLRLVFLSVFCSSRKDEDDDDSKSWTTISGCFKSALADLEMLLKQDAAYSWEAIVRIRCWLERIEHGEFDVYCLATAVNDPFGKLWCQIIMNAMTLISYCPLFRPLSTWDLAFWCRLKWITRRSFGWSVDGKRTTRGVSRPACHKANPVQKPQVSPIRLAFVKHNQEYIIILSFIF